MFIGPGECAVDETPSSWAYRSPAPLRAEKHRGGNMPFLKCAPASASCAAWKGVRRRLASGRAAAPAPHRRACLPHYPRSPHHRESPLPFDTGSNDHPVTARAGRVRRRQVRTIETGSSGPRRRPDESREKPDASRSCF